MALHLHFLISQQMRTKYLIPIVVFLLSISWNSTASIAQTIDDKFFFVIESSDDKYNSQTKQFKRLYGGGFENFQIQLSEEELKSIYHELDMANFSSLATSYEPKGDMRIITTPSFEYIVESNFGGEHRKIVYNDRITNDELIKEVAPFLAMYERIWEIIYSNLDVQKIRQSDIQWE